MSRIKRQAVVLIHGIGEQKPMDTLRGFVHSMTKGTDAKIYSQPDTTNDNYELRRLSVYTRGVRTDYYEYYWAYHMRGTKLGHVFSWIRQILFRPGSMSKRIKWLFYWIWFMIILITTTAILFAFNLGDQNWIHLDKIKVSEPVVLIFLNAFLGLLTYFMIYYLGDAARYTLPSPENIEDRKKIKSGGIQLLQNIHSKKNMDGSNRYDCIMVVGHSLGTIIGYDIIKHLWNDFYKLDASPTKEKPTALAKYEKEPTTKDFSLIQSEIMNEQRSLGNKWLITNFITLGSPLTHAALLMAQSISDMQERIHQRELPTCPPEFENDAISYKTEYGTYSLHHAAQFACTRWTNIYFQKDYVGGPLQPYFGQGITDYVINTTSGFLNTIPFLAHTSYWSTLHDKQEVCNESIDLIRRIIL